MSLVTQRFSLEGGGELIAASAPSGQMAVLWSAAEAPLSTVVVVPTSTYPAALVARDIATMAHLAPLHHVVVQGTDDEAELIAALLTNESVSLSSSAGTITNAYNRPAPPTPIEIFVSRDGEVAQRLNGS